MKVENYQKINDLMYMMGQEKFTYKQMDQAVTYLEEREMNTDTISIRSIGTPEYKVDKEHLIRFLKVEMTYAEKRIAEITKELEAL